MAFQEKSTWAQLIGIVAVFGFYFQRVIGAGPTRAEAIVLFVGAVVAIIVIQIVLHIAIAITSPRTAGEEDERDALIALKATRVSSFVLAVGVLLAAGLWLLDTTPFAMANAILLSLVLSEVTDCVIRIGYYRREA